MRESITPMGPMLVLAGLLVAWLAEVVSRDGGYGYNLDMAVGLAGGIVAGSLVWIFFSGLGMPLDVRIWLRGRDAGHWRPAWSLALRTARMRSRTEQETARSQGYSAELEDPAQPFCGSHVASPCNARARFGHEVAHGFL